MKDCAMAPATLTILVVWNLFAIPIAIWLLGKRRNRHGVRIRPRLF
jgi:hypothetical protein